VLSARSEWALEMRVARLRDHLRRHPDLSLDAVSRAACAGVRHFDHRVALVASSVAELESRLAEGRFERGQAGVRRPDVAWTVRAPGPAGVERLHAAAVSLQRCGAPFDRLVAADTTSRLAAQVIAGAYPLDAALRHLREGAPLPPPAPARLPIEAPPPSESGESSWANAHRTSERPEGSSANANGRPERPEGASANANRHPERPEGSSANANGRPERPEGSSANANRRPERPEGASASANRHPERPEGSWANANGRPERPEGSWANANGRPERPEGSWASAGQASAEGARAALALSLDEARPALLARLFAHGVDVDWAAACGPGPRVSLPPHPFRNRRFALYQRPLQSRATAPAAPSERLADAPPARRRERVEAALRRHLGALLGADAEALPLDAPLGSLGLDSLGVVEAVQRLQRELGITVYPDELLGADSLAALADRLAQQAGRARSGADPVPAPDAARAAAVAHLAARFPDAAAGGFRPTIEPRPDASAARSPVPPRPANRSADAPVAPLADRLPGPVFLLSAPRAGSTLLRAMLDRHPALFAPPELHLLLHPDMRAWDAALRPSMMHLGLQRALVDLGLDDAAAQAKLAAWAAAATPVAEVYAWLIRRAAPRLLVDKSPSYALDPGALARAESLFESPRYILLSRHPYAVVESFARLRMGRLFDAQALDPHLVAEAVWTRAETGMAELERALPGRCQRVAYEALVRDPEPALRDLAAFLGRPFDAATLRPYDGVRADGAMTFIGDPQFTTHTGIEPGLADRWKDARLPYLLGAEAVERAAILGYETPAEAPARAAAAEAAQLAADARLPATFPAPARTMGGDELLLTGATGFLGVHLLAELLRRTDRPIRCLVRAADADAAFERVRAAMADWDLWDAAFARRVIGEPGDLAALDARRLDALAERTAAVYHNGAVVSFTLPYATLRESNVAGTAALLALAARAGAPYHHVSTKGVFTAGAYPGDAPIDEDAPVRPVQGFALGYQRSKWVAEQLVAQARERGVPCTVYRPGRIGGHSATGRLTTGDFFWRMALGCAQLGALPDIAMPLEMVPVDHVAEAIVRLSLDASAQNHGFHLMHTRPVRADVLEAALGAAGVPVERWPWARWRETLRRQADNALAPLLGLFTETVPERVDESRFRTDNVRARLPDWAPPPVAAQVARVLEHMLRAGQLARSPTP
jgi:thioester reductase-like protein